MILSLFLSVSPSFFVLFCFVLFCITCVFCFCVLSQSSFMHCFVNMFLFVYFFNFALLCFSYKN